MRRQGNIRTGSFPFILGLALLLGCFVCSVELRAQWTETEALQGAEALPAGTPLPTGTGGAGTATDQTRKKPAKAARSKAKGPPANPVAAQAAER
ncbi:MAG: hypothetical protein ABSG91_23980, partial [Syntrophobacteraceae bacterium]